MSFCLGPDEVVEASFECEKVLQGYPATLHGGVVTALLDGAMTNCLFAHGHVSVTAQLEVRFRHPVATQGTARVRAWMVSSDRPLHELAAELIQDGRVKATARARFFDKTATRLFGRASFDS